MPDNPKAEPYADTVAVCPTCGRPTPRFVPGERGPFCTPMTCDEWTLEPLLPHQFPKRAPAEVIGWECAACGEWLDEGAPRHSSCPVDWRRHNDGW